MNRAREIALLRQAAKVLYDTAGPLGMDLEDQLIHGKFVTAATALESEDTPFDIEMVLFAAKRIVNTWGGAR